jgi:hypothetical protein
MLADRISQSKQGLECGTAVFLAIFIALQVFANDRRGLYGLYFPLMYFTDKFQLQCAERE